MKLIEDTKKKLKALQNKKKIELGELAHKCGLGDFELKDLKVYFQKLHNELSEK